jgi:hypothetical protein
MVGFLLASFALVIYYAWASRFVEPVIASQVKLAPYDRLDSQFAAGRNKLGYAKHIPVIGYPNGWHPILVGFFYQFVNFCSPV